MAIRMTLENYISDIAFQKFLDYAFQHSTSFSLTHNRLLSYSRSNPQEDNFLAQLNPFLQSSFTTKSWFYLTVGSKDSIIIDVFQAVPNAKEILLQHYRDLYLGYRSKAEWLPEDICFFLDNSLWIGTSSHEEICIAFPPELEMVEALKKYGAWKIEEIYNDPEQLDISDFVKA